MKKLLIFLPLVALLLTWGHYGAQQAEAPPVAVDLSIRVDAAGCTTAGGPTTCNVPVSTQFTVTMKVDVLPPSGDFDTFQGYLTHTAGLTWVDRGFPPPDPAEVVWVCDLPAEAPGAGYYLAGCTQIFSPPETQPTDLMEVDYTCGASPSSETVTMVHSYSSYTWLKDSNGQPAQDAGSESLTIECQAAPTEACCFPDGSCTDVDPAICTGSGGFPQGSGTNCAGVTCQAPPTSEVKWTQWPDESNWGLDVGTLEPGFPLVLADDFLCEQSGLITQIDFWASWFMDAPPMGDPNMVGFTLSLHSDVPAGVDRPWSHPGELLWEDSFGMGECFVEPWASGLLEGWYDPPSGTYVPVGDTEIWYYICPIPEPYWFQQEEGTIYWLDIQASPIEPGYFWGWKTSVDHWNDASVWAIGPEPVPPLGWFDLWHPPQHPLYGSPIDLAFQILGQACNPLLDSDADTFYDDVECYLPTDRSDDCTDLPGDVDAWPLDVNMDTFVTVGGDVLPYRGRIGAQGGVGDPNWLQRLDINADNWITVGGDVLPFRGHIGDFCP